MTSKTTNEFSPEVRERAARRLFHAGQPIAGTLADPAMTDRFDDAEPLRCGDLMKSGRVIAP
jgi:hypothetical protein